MQTKSVKGITLYYQGSRFQKQTILFEIMVMPEPGRVIIEISVYIAEISM
ncbi:hypothetical protein ACFL27_25815 [candidate division CSSED10-310 bacterium]|uniref:Uncharacterized protein n=1 Tax=candidate division CSSED10-310 bacterium TaxID=2855610 RepID=A0ABV6Z592_UNCC1